VVTQLVRTPPPLQPRESSRHTSIDVALHFARWNVEVGVPPPSCPHWSASALVGRRLPLLVGICPRWSASALVGRHLPSFIHSRPPLFVTAHPRHHPPSFVTPLFVRSRAPTLARARSLVCVHPPCSRSSPPTTWPCLFGLLSRSLCAFDRFLHYLGSAFVQACSCLFSLRSCLFVLVWACSCSFVL
jgi:hypothetical protein